jgi:hypothetical protein
VAHRLRSELGEYAPQRADPRRERVTVALDDMQLFDQRAAPSSSERVQGAWLRFMLRPRIREMGHGTEDEQSVSPPYSSRANMAAHLIRGRRKAPRRSL